MLGGIGNSEWLSECSEDDAMLLRLLLLLEVLDRMKRTEVLWCGWFARWCLARGEAVEVSLGVSERRLRLENLHDQILHAFRDMVNGHKTM